MPVMHSKAMVRAPFGLASTTTASGAALGADAETFVAPHTLFLRLTRFANLPIAAQASRVSKQLSLRTPNSYNTNRNLFKPLNSGLQTTNLRCNKKATR